MQDQIINKTIKFLAGETSEVEAKQVMEWRKQNKGKFEEIKLIYEAEIFENKNFDIAIAKKRILNKIYEDESQVRKIASKKSIDQIWYKVAAVFIGLIAIGISIYLYNNSLYHENTNMTTQVIEITLPDGSLVSLDKNSKLSFKNTWLNKFNREVYLSGRAYFQIKRDVSHTFFVKTTDTQVEVLGTKFTISDIYGKTQIVLNEGKVSVTSDKVDDTYLLDKQGEQLVISEDGVVKQGIINKNLYFSWLEEKLNFSNCKVSETLAFLSDSYNLNIKMKDKDGLEKHLFGSAPSDNPQLIIEAIATITNKRIRKNEQSFILE